MIDTGGTMCYRPTCEVIVRVMIKLYTCMQVKTPLCRPTTVAFRVDCVYRGAPIG